MLVLMDIEWIENRRSYFCPTQISAMRVDNMWNCIDRFDALIKPFDSSCKDWKHVAYSGADPEAFLSAEAGPQVFLHLFRWLEDSDILCWWVEQPALVFINVVGNLLHRNVDHDMRLIYPAWCATTLDGKKTIGSPYTLALARDIHVPDVQHCSANDVEAIRSLLSETYASKSAIRRSLIDPEAKLLTKKEYRKIKKAANHTNILYLDPETWILHDKACPDIAGRTDLIGLSSYKEAIKKRPQPCICCHENYIVENWILSSKSIRNCHFKFIYSERGGLFHNLDCILTRQIPYMDLKGTAYYEKCITKGFQPCRYCKPTFSDQVLQFDETRNSNYISQGKWHTTRLLKREEVVALHRQEIALKERIALSKTAKLKTETEIRDEHVLTRSGYAFWAASGYQTFHLRSCPKLDHISGLNGFAKYTDALRAGFTACKLCKPSSKYDILISVPIYHQERQGETIDTLNRLCDEYGFQHRFESRYYYIDTPVGKWQIKVYTRPVDVYHINSSTNPDTIHYHKQKRLFLSLTDTFEYIKRHDLSLMKKVGKECVNISKISSN